MMQIPKLSSEPIELAKCVFLRSPNALCRRTPVPRLGDSRSGRGGARRRRIRPGCPLSSRFRAALSPVVWLLLAATGCNSGPIEYLTTDDVTNLPAGDAVGTVYDGRIYRPTSLVIETCQCMPGSVSFGLPCTGEVPLAADAPFVQVLQSDGEVNFRLLRRNADGDFEEVPLEDSPVIALAPGSLFEDGTFLVGTVIPLLDAGGVEVGQTITLIEGQIFDDRLELDFTLRGTVAENGQMDDCQLTGVQTFVREQ